MGNQVVHSIDPNTNTNTNLDEHFHRDLFETKVIPPLTDKYGEVNYELNTQIHSTWTLQRHSYLVTRAYIYKIESPHKPNKHMADYYVEIRSDKDPITHEIRSVASITKYLDPGYCASWLCCCCVRNGCWRNRLIRVVPLPLPLPR